VDELKGLSEQLAILTKLQSFEILRTERRVVYVLVAARNFWSNRTLWIISERSSRAAVGRCILTAKAVLPHFDAYESEYQLLVIDEAWIFLKDQTIRYRITWAEKTAIKFFSLSFDSRVFW
jgi:hypothetical protein